MHKILIFCKQHTLVHQPTFISLALISLTALNFIACSRKQTQSFSAYPSYAKLELFQQKTDPNTNAPLFLDDAKTNPIFTQNNPLTSIDMGSVPFRIAATNYYYFHNIGEKSAEQINIQVLDTVNYSVQSQCSSSLPGTARQRADSKQGFCTFQIVFKPKRIFSLPQTQLIVEFSSTSLNEKTFQMEYPINGYGLLLPILSFESLNYPLNQTATQLTNAYASVNLVLNLTPEILKTLPPGAGDIVFPRGLINELTKSVSAFRIPNVAVPFSDADISYLSSEEQPFSIFTTPPAGFITNTTSCGAGTITSPITKSCSIFFQATPKFLPQTANYAQGGISNTVSFVNPSSVSQPGVPSYLFKTSTTISGRAMKFSLDPLPLQVSFQGPTQTAPVSTAGYSVPNNGTSSPLVVYFPTLNAPYDPKDPTTIDWGLPIHIRIENRSDLIAIVDSSTFNRANGLLPKFSDNPMNIFVDGQPFPQGIAPDFFFQSPLDLKASGTGNANCLTALQIEPAAGGKPGGCDLYLHYAPLYAFNGKVPTRSRDISFDDSLLRNTFTFTLSGLADQLRVSPNVPIPFQLKYHFADYPLIPQPALVPKVSINKVAPNSFLATLNRAIGTFYTNCSRDNILIWSIQNIGSVFSKFQVLSNGWNFNRDIGIKDNSGNISMPILSLSPLLLGSGATASLSMTGQYYGSASQTLSYTVPLISVTTGSFLFDQNSNSSINSSAFSLNSSIIHMSPLNLSVSSTPTIVSIASLPLENGRSKYRCTGATDSSNDLCSSASSLMCGINSNRYENKYSIRACGNLSNTNLNIKFNLNNNFFNFIANSSCLNSGNSLVFSESPMSYAFTFSSPTGSNGSECILNLRATPNASLLSSPTCLASDSNSIPFDSNRVTITADTNPSVTNSVNVNYAPQPKTTLSLGSASCNLVSSPGQNSSCALTYRNLSNVFSIKEILLNNLPSNMRSSFLNPLTVNLPANGQGNFSVSCPYDNDSAAPDPIALNGNLSLTGRTDVSAQGSASSINVSCLRTTDPTITLISTQTNPSNVNVFSMERSIISLVSKFKLFAIDESVLAPNPRLIINVTQFGNGTQQPPGNLSFDGDDRSTRMTCTLVSGVKYQFDCVLNYNVIYEGKNNIAQSSILTFNVSSRSDSSALLQKSGFTQPYISLGQASITLNPISIKTTFSVPNPGHQPKVTAFQIPYNDLSVSGLTLPSQYLFDPTYDNISNSNNLDYNAEFSLSNFQASNCTTITLTNESGLTATFTSKNPFTFPSPSPDTWPNYLPSTVTYVPSGSSNCPFGKDEQSFVFPQSGVCKFQLCTNQINQAPFNPDQSGFSRSSTNTLTLSGFQVGTNFIGSSSFKLSQPWVRPMKVFGGPNAFGFLDERGNLNFMYANGSSWSTVAAGGPYVYSSKFSNQGAVSRLVDLSIGSYQICQIVDPVGGGLGRSLSCSPSPNGQSNWTPNFSNLPLTTGYRPLKVASGSRHACVLSSYVDASSKTQYAVNCFGSNSVGQLGSSNATMSAIDSGTMNNQLIPIDISVGDNTSCATLINQSTNAASLKCWGLSGSSQLGTRSNEQRINGFYAISTPTSVSNVQPYLQNTSATNFANAGIHSIFAGLGFPSAAPVTCVWNVISSKVQLQCFGSASAPSFLDNNVLLGTNSNCTSQPFSTADAGCTIALSGLSGSPVDPGMFAKMGYNHLCALSVNNINQSSTSQSFHNVTCWGANDLSQLNTTPVREVFPVPLVPTLQGTLTRDYLDLAVSSYSNCVVTSENILLCWGGQSPDFYTNYLSHQNPSDGGFLHTVRNGMSLSP